MLWHVLAGLVSDIRGGASRTPHPGTVLKRGLKFKPPWPPVASECHALSLRVYLSPSHYAPSDSARSISSGGVLAHCRGFGTCGWTDVGDPSPGPILWDPLPWRHGSREQPQRPVGCPSTLARGVGQLRFGPTRSPVLRISDSVIL
jgi:hypothetical protein